MGIHRHKTKTYACCVQTKYTYKQKFTHGYSHVGTHKHTYLNLQKMPPQIKNFHSYSSPIEWKTIVWIMRGIANLLSEASMKKPVEMSGLSSQWCEAAPSSQITTTVHKKKHYRWSLPYLWIHFYVSVLTSKAYSLFKKKTKKSVHKKTYSRLKIKVMVTIIHSIKIRNFK